MLKVGLTGGIGAGKSTVSARLAELGARVVDADRVAREVVEPGTAALRQIRERFGDGVFTGEVLDRPALGAVVFSDPEALRDLEGITHPAIWARTAELFAEAARDGVLVAVHDMPLLVEKRMTGEYHLVLVVDTDVEERVRRIVANRGVPESDARARMAAQASDDQRRAAADVLIDNNGAPEQAREAVDRLWAERIAPFAENLVAGRRTRRPERVVLDMDDGWSAAGERLASRVRLALGARAAEVQHIGSTAVPDLVAKDVIDLQVGVARLADADDPGFVEAMRAAGYPRVPGVEEDVSKDGSRWWKRLHGGCDPGQIVHVHVRELGSPGWRWSLLFRDWLRADGQARIEYAELKRSIVADAGLWDRYPEAKEPWFAGVHARMERWADETGWAPGDR